MKRLQLFDRLPAIHKIKDGELGGPLQAYLQPVEDAFNAVKDSIDGLYHDLFIDFCAPWVIPYIGDLLGTSHLAGDAATLRADVADTIFLRRAKGTLGAIERVAHDLTGWGAYPVELRENLAWAQSVNHQRPDRGGLPAYAPAPYGRHTVIRGGFATIRDPAVLDQLGTPYDRFARFPDVSTVQPYQVKYNLPNVAVFLWRLASYEIELQRSLATPPQAIVQVGSTFVARFFVHPLSRPVQLFGRSAYDPDRRPIVLTPLDAQPAPISRARLGPETTKDPIGVANPDAYVAVREYDPALPIERGSLPIEIYVPTGLPKDWTIRGANLCAWEGGIAPPLAPNEIAIDPVIGRIAIGAASQPIAQTLVDELAISYHYGAVGPVGAHPVVREDLPDKLPPPLVVDGKPGSPTLEQALAGLATITDAPLVVVIEDDQIHDLDVNNVNGSGELEVGRPLYLRAADDRRPIVRLAQPLRFVTAALDASEVKTTVRIDGLFFVAGFASADPLITRVAIEALDLRGCTLDPGGDAAANGQRSASRPAMRLAETYEFSAADLAKFALVPSIELSRTICGSLFIDADAYTLSLASSIVDAAAIDAPALAGAGDPATTFAARTQIDRVTIFGTSRVQRISGRGGIFTGTLFVDDDQHGCLKLCWFSNDGDRLPQNADCLKAPDARLVFTSEAFGDPAYAQLALDCDPRILNRGPDDDQMGAYGFLLEAHKWANLTIRLRELIPVGTRPLLVPAT